MNRGAAQPKLGIDAEERNLVVRHAFDKLKYAAVGEAYGRCFAEWIPVDAAEFSPENSQQGISRLFQEFGVDRDYWHPIYQTRAITSVRRAMLSNVINLTGLDHALYVHLDYTGQSLYSHTFPLIELATSEPNHLWDEAGFANQPVSLVVNFEQWVLQSLQTRKRLLTEGTFQFILEKVAIPAWIDCHRAWKCATGDYFIDDWQQLIERRICTLADVRHHVGYDVGRFLEEHPNFHRKWPNIELIL